MNKPLPQTIYKRLHAAKLNFRKRFYHLKKLRFAMRLTLGSLLLISLHLSASTRAQDVTLTAQNADLHVIFKQLHQQTGYYFIYNENLIKTARPVNIVLKNTSLTSALDKLLSGHQLSYVIKNNTIVINKKLVEAEQATITISGTVYDTHEPPTPLAGVSIKIKGTQQGTVTDKDGFFSINARKGDILVFTMISFEQREFTVSKNEKNLPISLKDNISSLDEVVVVGMTEQQKKHIASSLSVLKIESNVAGKPITTLSQALQGGVTGIQVSQSSGLPGGDAASMKIRGVTTLNNSNPLVLVDGIPMDMNHIDPVTIESVTVLKDAAAASIYGSRAANGVIVVTTKRGKPGRVMVGYDGYFGVQSPTKLPKTVDAVQYMQLYNEAVMNAGNPALYSEEEIDLTREGTDPLRYPNVDWTTLMIDKSAPIMSHSLSLSGGNNLARFAITGNYLDQTGMIPSTGMKRFNIRANTTVSLSDKFLVNLDLIAIKRNKEMINRVNSSGTLRFMEDLYRVTPNVVPRYPAKGRQTFYGQFVDIVNPLAYAEVGGVRKNEYAESSINFQPKWTVIPGLNLNGQFSFRLNSDASRIKRENFNHFDYYTGVLLRTWGLERSASQARSTYYFLSANADYSLKKDNHYLYGIAGYSQEQKNSGDWTILSLRSGFAKVNYTFDDRYLLEGTMRMDGSSRFGQGKKYGYFPSAALGWNVHNEHFLSEVGAVKNLKVRASYGSLGNENVDPYLYQSLLSPSTGLETTHGNPDISWERVDMLDIGVDIGLFAKNKLEITFDYYNKKTNGIILEPQLPLTGGFQSKVPVNAGKVKNKGWEATINYNETLAKGISFSFRPGVSFNKNKITDLPGGPYFSGTTRNQIGYSIGSIYGYKANGLLQTKDFDEQGKPLLPVKSSQTKPGDIKYLDLNQDGKIDEADQTIIGKPTPDLNYFANLQLGIKKFDFEVLFQGTGKSDAAIAGMFALPLDMSKDGGVPTKYYANNYWTENRTNAQFPRLNTNPADNRQSSDFWFQNAAYLRVKYIQLGYTLDKKMVAKAGVSGVRIYMNAQNPFTFTTMKLVDPESRGDQWKYGLMSTYSFGTSVRF